MKNLLADALRSDFSRDEPPRDELLVPTSPHGIEEETTRESGVTQEQKDRHQEIQGRLSELKNKFAQFQQRCTPPRPPAVSHLESL